MVLVRRGDEGFTTTSQLTEQFLNSIDVVKPTTKTLGLHNTDLLFSSFVLLVEGEGDVVAFRRFLALLFQHKKRKHTSPSLAGVSVIDCGGKDGIRALAKIVDHLQIPYVAVFDRDVIQQTDSDNKWTIGQTLVEKTYLKQLSGDYHHQSSLFSSEAE